MVEPGGAASVQLALDRNPPGTTFCFARGLYRFTRPIVPKPGQRLIGNEPGVVLNGSKVVKGFVSSGPDFVATGYLQGAHLSSRNCIAPKSGCDTPQDVFLSGRPLQRVTSRAALHAGAFYEDFARNTIWLRDDPRGRLVEQAFAAALIESSAGGIIVQGFQIEEAATPAQYGAVAAVNYRGDGWRIEHATIANNHAAGIFIGPADAAEGGSVISHNAILDNGQEGIAGYGPGHVVEANEIARNNRVGYSCYWECGGAKFGAGPGLEIQHVAVTGNNVHDNYGDGFWVDINGYDVSFTHNVVTNNKQLLPGSKQHIGAGIFLEISDRATVTDNDVEYNGPAGTATDKASYYQGAQILIAATANVAVGSNRVAGAGGIGMLQQARTDSCSFGAKNSPRYPDGALVCPHRYQGRFIHWTHDNRFQENHVTETAPPGYAEVAGLDCDLLRDAPAFSPMNENLYSHNVYHLPDVGGAYFSWRNVLNGAHAWQGFGQDYGSRF
ncbi:MAG: right-handed parallel beta-helix repeat-containing protein [Candidatus Eremiobacteraeota bacterium]|nr:right-handed parallel beta-helix repeat-containing protein [Candidatus Eremiobacteraeota bacterium]